MCGSRWGTGVRTPLKNYKNIGFFSNICPDPQLNHKAYKPAFSVGPLSAPQRKKGKNIGPPLKKLSGSAHVSDESESV